MIDTRALGLSTRQYLVQKGTYPEVLRKMREGISINWNVTGRPNDERTFWADFAPLPVSFLDPVKPRKVDCVYFVGCLVSFSPTIQDIACAVTEVLGEAEVDYLCLGTEEWCCGYPLIIAGMRDEVGELKQHNIELVREAGAKTVIFSCPSCFHTWRHEYAERLPGVTLLHSTQMLLKLLNEGRVKLSPLKMKVAYHDPCDLGRNSGVYEEPRQVINSIPGVRLSELESSKELAWCCGGGGDVEMVDERIPYKVAKIVLDEVEVAGAEALVTACGQCKRVFLKTASSQKRKLEILDVAELVLRSMKAGELNPPKASALR
jgi:heterodisulfide reductase subunit D